MIDSKTCVYLRGMALELCAIIPWVVILFHFLKINIISCPAGFIGLRLRLARIGITILVLRSIHLVLHVLLHITKLPAYFLGGPENRNNHFKYHFINNVCGKRAEYKIYYHNNVNIQTGNILGLLMFI